MTETNNTKTTDKPLFWVVVFSITLILGLINFGVIDISMEDDEGMPVYMSGEPADLPSVANKIELVESAGCSRSKLGIDIVKEAVLSVMRIKADDVGGVAIIDVTFSFDGHESISTKCPYPVTGVGMAVDFDD